MTDGIDIHWPTLKQHGRAILSRELASRLVNNKITPDVAMRADASMDRLVVGDGAEGFRGRMILFYLREMLYDKAIGWLLEGNNGVRQ